MEPFRGEGIVRTRRTWLLALTMLAILFVPSMHLDERFAGLSGAWLLPLLASVLSGIVPSLLLNVWPRVRRGTITVDAEHVLVDGRPAVARARLRDGRRHTNKERVVAVLQPLLRHGIFPIEVELARDAEVETFLAALRLDRAHRATKVAVVFGDPRRAALRTFILPLVGMPILLGLVSLTIAGMVAARAPAWLGGVLALPSLAAYVAAALLVGSESVTVGNDGLLLRRTFFRRRFVAYGEIARIETEENGLTLHLVDGEAVRMSYPLMRTAGKRAAHDLARAVDEARAQHATATAPEKVTATLLARSGRDALAWLEALRHVADDSTSYRDPALAPERLWMIVEDATASPTARAGAAFALRRHIDDAGRKRLRVATDACAAPRLRVAFEAAASADEDALNEALGALQDETTTTRASV